MSKEYVQVLISESSLDNLKRLIGQPISSLEFRFIDRSINSNVKYPDCEDFPENDIPCIDKFSGNVLNISFNSYDKVSIVNYWGDTPKTYIDFWDFECLLNDENFSRDDLFKSVLVSQEYSLNNISKIEIYSYIESFYDDIEKCISDRAIRFISENGNSFILGANDGISGTANIWVTQEAQSWYLRKTNSFLRLVLSPDGVEHVYNLDDFYHN